MVFIGSPGLYVRISNKFIQRATSKKGFYFDKLGKYETENEWLIKLLMQYFKVEENEDKEPKKEKLDGDNAFKCKKCNFETDNKGTLMRHYKEHKKEE